MATNDFLPFATAGGANVVTQSAYAALAALSTGYQSGVANSAQLNKTWRQSSIMSAVLAQFISDNTGANAVDDGTTATLLSNLKVATAGRLLNFQIFASTGTSTYTPTQGTRSVLVEMVGGGGGSGATSTCNSSQFSLSGGGSGGAYGRGYFTSGFSGVTVTVGSGGSAGVAPAGNAGNGGTSSFGALMSVSGGAGSLGSAALTGNTVIGGAVAALSAPGANLFSSAGGYGTYGISLTAFISGTGGGSFFGAGGAPINSTGVGQAPGGPGAGAGGSLTVPSGVQQNGRAGASGLVLVWEFS